MVRANGLFRAVHLNVGRHTVEFAYSPSAMWWGIVVSGITLFAMSAMLLRSRALRRRTIPAKAGTPPL